MANASTYDFPVIYKILKGASIEQILSGDPVLLDLVIQGGKELIQQGARAITGACGSFAYYQKAAAVEAAGCFMFHLVFLPVSYCVYRSRIGVREPLVFENRPTWAASTCNLSCALVSLGLFFCGLLVCRNREKAPPGAGPGGRRRHQP